jgi:DGQHR domain-containing protein
LTDEQIILDGLISNEELKRISRRRRVKYEYKLIIKEELDNYLKDGWEKNSSRERQKIKIRKIRDIGPGFEDEVWSIFYKMGFTEMNKDNTFNIPRFSNHTLTKQIDVYAKDEQCVCFIECKAAENTHTKRQLDKEIDQIAGLRHDIELSVFSHYRNPKDKKIKKIKTAWILAVKNIDLSENDLQRAQTANIKIFDTKQIEYYSALANHFGKASKYQFLADIFPGIEIPDMIEPVEAIKGKMGELDFYTFVMEPIKLLKIGYIAHRAKTTEETFDTYQRMAKKSRLKKIASYIHTEHGFFPTSIVINIQTEKGKSLRFDKSCGVAGDNASLGKLYIPNCYKTAWIIDGQHRLFAYADLKEAKTATLPVIAFENLQPDIQAKLFININGEQVRVSKNLLHDLYSTIHWNSDNPSEQLKALTSRLVKELNDNKNSPLRDRIISIEGKKTQLKNITLTTLTEEIRKRQLIGYTVSKKDTVINPGPLYDIDMERTLIRSRDTISGYLTNYVNKDEGFKNQWEIGNGEGGYVSTNSGLIAILRVLKAILDHLEHIDNIEIRKLKTIELLDRIWKYQEPVCKFIGSADASTIHTFRERHGEAGFTVCANALFYEIHKVYNAFNPPGLKQYILTQDTSNNPKAYDMIFELERELLKYLIKKLKGKYGEDIKGWWHKGIPPRIRKKAVEEAQNKGEYESFERFLYLIDQKEIIEENFDLFGGILTFDAKPTDSKSKRVHWLVELNDIRSIVFHPPKGGISTEQFEYLTRIYPEIMKKLTENLNKE